MHRNHRDTYVNDFSKLLDVISILTITVFEVFCPYWSQFVNPVHLLMCNGIIYKISFNYPYAEIDCFDNLCVVNHFVRCWAFCDIFPPPQNSNAPHSMLIHLWKYLPVYLAMYSFMFLYHKKYLKYFFTYIKVNTK